MRVTSSELRSNVYRLLDEVIETGVPLEIVRKGRILLVIPEDPPDRLSGLKRRDDALVGDPEDFIHMDWSSEWKP